MSGLPPSPPVGPCLFLDASGLTARVGLWDSGRWLAYREDRAAALEALFHNLPAALVEAGVAWPQIAGYLFVEGPGSVLGLRLAAMALRAWQVDAAAQGRSRPLFACGSLRLAAALALAGGAQPPFAICTEARQNLFHLLEITDASQLNAAATREVQPDALPRGVLFHLPARKAWAGAPAHAQPLPASLRDHPEILAQPGLLHPADLATPSGAPPAYRKWAPAVS
jgi:tRNA threonylcarbamoyladenosine biosynthesis protein TsaB